MQSKWAGVLPQPHLDLAGGIALWRPAGPSSGSANSSWKLFKGEDRGASVGHIAPDLLHLGFVAETTKVLRAESHALRPALVLVAAAAARHGLGGR